MEQTKVPLCRYCGFPMHMPLKHRYQYECPECGALAPECASPEEAYEKATQPLRRQPHLLSVKELSNSSDPVYIEIRNPEAPLHKLILVEAVVKYTSEGPFRFEHNYGLAKIQGRYNYSWRAWDSRPDYHLMVSTKWDNYPDEDTILYAC